VLTYGGGVSILNTFLFGLVSNRYRSFCLHDSSIWVSSWGDQDFSDIFGLKFSCDIDPSILGSYEDELSIVRSYLGLYLSRAPIPPKLLNIWPCSVLPDITSTLAPIIEALSVK
jgi:hypothetical protein